MCVCFTDKPPAVPHKNLAPCLLITGYLGKLCILSRWAALHMARLCTGEATVDIKVTAKLSKEFPALILLVLLPFPLLISVLYFSLYH